MLDRATLVRLAKVLGMLGSEHAGERAAAGAAADRFLKQAELTWGELLGCTGAAQHPATSPPGDSDWHTSKPTPDGRAGSWCRRDGIVLAVRQCRPPSSSWFATFGGRMVFDPQGRQFFDSEAHARLAAETWQDRYDAGSRQ